jgi:hypothetical protein
MEHGHENSPEDHDEASLNVPNIDLVPGCLALPPAITNTYRSHLAEF